MFAKPLKIKMPEPQKPKRNNADYTNVCVHKNNLQEVKNYLEEQDEFHIGKFYEKAAIERLARLRSNSGINLLSTTTLLQNGWAKTGSSTYKREGCTILYNGVNWFLDGELLTEQNYKEKIK